MSLCYIILPNRFPNGINEILINSSKHFISKDERALFHKNDLIYSLSDNFICKEWAIELLSKYGTTSHKLNEEDELYYYVYWAALSRDFVYYYYIRKIHMLKPDYNINLISEDIQRFFREHKFAITIPPITKLNRISFHRYKIYKKSKYVKPQVLRYLFLIFNLSGREIIRKIIKRVHIFSNKIQYGKIVRQMRALGIENIQKIKVKGSSSGALFFLGEKEGHKLFVKCNDISGGIACEIKALRTLEENGKTNLFVKSIINDNNIIGYEYYEHITLSELLLLRKLDETEKFLLLSFAKKVLESLDRSKIVHCDIRPENIFVLRNQEGKANNFLLTDFGLAIIDGVDYSKNNYMRKIELLYAGHIHRYSENIIDDAASFCSMFTNDCEISLSDIKEIELSIGTQERKVY